MVWCSDKTHELYLFLLHPIGLYFVNPCIKQLLLCITAYYTTYKAIIMCYYVIQFVKLPIQQFIVLVLVTEKANLPPLHF